MFCIELIYSFLCNKCWVYGVKASHFLQNMHPNKRNYSASLNAIDRLWLMVASTLKHHLQSVFDVSESTLVYKWSLWHGKKLVTSVSIARYP